jgi:hypothetical protein
MKGAFRMKILKNIFLILFGYIMFVLITAGLESIVVSYLGSESSIFNNLQENAIYTLIIYIVINILFWGINYILNYKTVEKLNKSLKIINKEGKKDEK